MSGVQTMPVGGIDQLGFQYWYWSWAANQQVPWLQIIQLLNTTKIQD